MKKQWTIIVLLTLACGAVATLWGIFHMPWPSASAFSWAPQGQYAILLLIVLLATALTARWLKISYLTASVLFFGVIALSTGTTLQLLVTIWLWLSSYALGGLVFSLLKIDVQKSNVIHIALAGFVLYGTFIGIIAHYPINYPGLYGAMLALPLVLKWRLIYSTICNIIESWTLNKQTHPIEFVIAIVAIFYFFIALMPEVGHDALAMHLFVPAHLAIRHAWSFDVTSYIWAVMPMTGDWIYSLAYMEGGEVAARLINISFIFALAWLVRDLALWAGGSMVGARWAVLLFLTTPLTFLESSSLFVESIWACFVVGGSLSIFKLLQSDEDHKIQLLTAAILLGGALSAKAVTFTILPSFIFLMAWRYQNWLRRDLALTLLTGSGIFILIGMVPYLTAWSLTGNPVFPLFNHIFKSAFWPIKDFTPPLCERGLSWDSLYQVTFHTEKFLESRPGAAGFQWLMLFIPAVSTLFPNKQYRAMALFFTAVLSIALTFHSTAYLRYIFPSFVWVLAGFGVALFSFSQGRYTRKIILTSGIIVVMLNLLFFRSGTYYSDISLKALASQTGREAYLSKRLPIRNAVKIINELNIEHTPVAVFSNPLTAGLKSAAIYTNWYNYKFSEEFSKTKTSDGIARLLSDKNVSYLILDSNWNTASTRTLIENATEKITEIGPISIRRMDQRYLFTTELLKDPTSFANASWVINSPESVKPSGDLAVTVATPATQAISIVPGRRYKNSVIARCTDEPSQGRVQVNWLDSKSNFISTDIQVFDCTPSDTSYSMIVTAPNTAKTAVVYASGHTSTPIIVREVSFKR